MRRSSSRRPIVGVALAVIALHADAPHAQAQIRVNPTGVSTNAMNPTTVFLTFGGLRNQVPVEGLWCGEVLPAVAPDRGTRCDPNTVYGRLPLRSDLARVSAAGVLTDIMSIPSSVARRAYLAAARGQSATFFYVRRFTSTTGGADEFVAVTCRLTGGGAGVPLSLTNVTVAFETTTPVQVISPGQRPPALSATVAFNGSGVLRGRWEVVMPGEELPTANDLLTEGTLTAEERGRQRRYALLDRFNITLPPGGRVTIPGPDPDRLPHDVDGTYVVLLRIESSDDNAGDSNLEAVGAGSGVLHNGAVAGFPMPTLRYVVGSGEATAGEIGGTTRTVQLLAPRVNAVVAADSSLTVAWSAVWGAAYYRVEFERTDGTTLLSALVRKSRTTYDVPLPLGGTTASGAAGAPSAGLAQRRTVRWRVSALDGTGRVTQRSAWRALRLGPPSSP